MKTHASEHATLPGDARPSVKKGANLNQQSNAHFGQPFSRAEPKSHRASIAHAVLPSPAGEKPAGRLERLLAKIEPHSPMAASALRGSVAEPSTTTIRHPAQKAEAHTGKTATPETLLKSKPEPKPELHPFRRDDAPAGQPKAAHPATTPIATSPLPTKLSVSAGVSHPPVPPLEVPAESALPSVVGKANPTIVTSTAAQTVDTDAVTSPEPAQGAGSHATKEPLSPHTASASKPVPATLPQPTSMDDPVEPRSRPAIPTAQPHALQSQPATPAQRLATVTDDIKTVIPRSESKSEYPRMKVHTSIQTELPRAASAAEIIAALTPTRKSATTVQMAEPPADVVALPAGVVPQAMGPDAPTWSPRVVTDRIAAVIQSLEPMPKASPTPFLRPPLAAPAHHKPNDADQTPKLDAQSKSGGLQTTIKATIVVERAAETDAHGKAVPPAKLAHGAEKATPAKIDPLDSATPEPNRVGQHDMADIPTRQPAVAVPAAKAAAEAVVAATPSPTPIKPVALPAHKIGAPEPMPALPEVPSELATVPVDPQVAAVRSELTAAKAGPSMPKILVEPLVLTPLPSPAEAPLKKVSIDESKLDEPKPGAEPVRDAPDPTPNLTAMSTPLAQPAPLPAAPFHLSAAPEQPENEPGKATQSAPSNHAVADKPAALMADAQKPVPVHPAAPTADARPAPAPAPGPVPSDNSTKASEPAITDGRPNSADTSSPAQSQVTVVERPVAAIPLPAMSPPALSVVTALSGNAAWTAALAPTQALADQPEIVAKPLDALKIQLNPVDLGIVTARLHIENGSLTVAIEVDNPEALHRLAADRDTIERALRSVGMQVADVTIQQAQPASANQQAQTDGRGAQPQSGHGQQTQQQASAQSGQNNPGSNGGNGSQQANDNDGGARGRGSDNGDRGAARGGVYI